MPPLDIETLRSWVGRSETREDTIDATPIARLAATLDRDDAPPRPGDAVPPLWHWLYFLPLYRQSEVGADGHAKRGGFLPPVPLPRRMWAGSRIEWHAAAARWRERDAAVAHRVGDAQSAAAADDLVFVVVRHEISVARRSRAERGA